jgi:hypothetical protein
MSDRLGDYVKIGDLEEVETALSSLSRKLKLTNSWIIKNLKRTEESVVISNISSAAVAQLDVATLGIRAHVSVLALATRSLFELDNRLKTIIKSKVYFDAWNVEAAVDRIQFIEGLLEIETVSDSRAQKLILQEEMVRIRDLVKKYKLPENAKLLSASQIAKDAGAEKEYKSFFKIFSKLVHPSSLLVNGPTFADSLEVRAMLQIHAQVYGWSVFSLVSKHFEVPEAVTDNHSGSD